MSERVAELDLPGLPERPWRDWEITGVLRRPDGEVPPVPLTCPAVVEAVHTGTLSQWALRVRAPLASRALEAAELVLPEAAGATWTVGPSR